MCCAWLVRYVGAAAARLTAGKQLEIGLCADEKIQQLEEQQQIHQSQIHLAPFVGSQQLLRHLVLT